MEVLRQMDALTVKALS
jgi:hypothetical protein